MLVAQDYAAIGLPVIPLKPGGKRPVTAPKFSDDEASERDADEPTPLGITAQRTTAERNDRMAKSGTSGDGLAMRLKHGLLDKRVEGETNLLNLAQRINA